MKSTVKKTLVLAALAGFTMASANAQVQFGLKAGANFATWTGKDADGSKSLVSFNGGALVKIPASEQFSVQPEIFFSGQGAKANDDNGGNDDLKTNLNYLNIPVLVKYQHASGLFAETGPQIGFLLTAKAKASSGGTSVSSDVKSSFNSADFSWAFGVGYLSSANIGLDVRYNLGLSNIAKAQNGTTYSVKNGVFQVGVFYLFGDSGGKKK